MIYCWTLKAVVKRNAVQHSSEQCSGCANKTFDDELKGFIYLDKNYLSKMLGQDERLVVYAKIRQIIRSS